MGSDFAASVMGRERILKKRMESGRFLDISQD
jgi:hypothetical protein